MKHSTGKPTKAEAARMAAIKGLWCAACVQQKYPFIWGGPSEVHHLLSGNKRRGHMFTIPLCAWHHRGVTGERVRFIEEVYGPSLARTSKKFRESFGSDDELLEQTNKRLEAYK